MTPLLIPAGNPSEWTGPTGNNTWLLKGHVPALVDAGVGRPEHIEAIARALDGSSLARVFITHGHPDHVGGLPALRARWPDLDVIPIAPPERTEHGASDSSAQTIDAGDGTLRVIATPGHAPDHLCFFDQASGDLYCGDLARRGGTVVIPASQGGDLRAYLASLRVVRDLGPRRLLPGHGPVIDDPAALIDEYLAHREARERQIVEAMGAGARTVDEIVRRVYPDLLPALHPAAAETVRAHLAKLDSESRQV